MSVVSDYETKVKRLRMTATMRKQLSILPNWLNPFRTPEITPEDAAVTAREIAEENGAVLVTHEFKAPDKLVLIIDKWI